MRFTAMAGLLLDTAALAMPLIKPGCRGRVAFARAAGTGGMAAGRAVFSARTG